jgi:hypothetical protein
MQALYFAGLFLLLSGRLDKAKEYIDRMIKISPAFKEVLVNTAKSAYNEQVGAIKSVR